MRTRKIISGIIVGLLLVALLPFLVLCLVFCLKLFLAAVIIGVAAALLIAGACVLYSLAWMASVAGRRRQARPRPAAGGPPTALPKVITGLSPEADNAPGLARSA
ncbi:MAG: hypothetical protein H0W83_08855 [Planctomycetes bacterium]|nr:hypothetical protein [Planctomycetota bacterium]